jgi:hypothetical protein
MIGHDVIPATGLGVFCTDYQKIVLVKAMAMHLSDNGRLRIRKTRTLREYMVLYSALEITGEYKILFSDSPFEYIGFIAYRTYDGDKESGFYVQLPWCVAAESKTHDGEKVRVAYDRFSDYILQVHQESFSGS